MLEPKASLQPQPPLREAINSAFRAEEAHYMDMLIKAAQLSTSDVESIRKRAMKLVEQVREGRRKSTGIDSFLTEYALSSDEGIALMCLAEAMLRVPDNETIDILIRDKLSGPDWDAHRGQSDSFFVNAATWALMLTGKVLSPERIDNDLGRSLFRLANRTGEGVIRKAVEKAMRIMSKQFVMGRTIGEALNRARKKEALGYRYSYDMLGEAALTAVDAARYLEAYMDAIDSIGAQVKGKGDVYTNPGISIKLSALHPRYQESQYESVMATLPDNLLALCLRAKAANIGLTIDAEESERLEISLDVIEKVFKNPALNGWNGFGMAVQSYQKRAFYLLDWVAGLARGQNRRMNVRLIKGAYWDSEIKKAQMQGLTEYPVFTRKVFTDVSFQACAKKILTMTDAIYPQFATHNACSVATILEMCGSYRDFEFQCLHGMGNELYAEIVPANRLGIPCRIYAPVGTHEDLLPYLVRRLLENGANSSFVNRIVDENAPISELVEDPVSRAKALLESGRRSIPLPRDIFMPERPNSAGLDLNDRTVRRAMAASIEARMPFHFEAAPMMDGRAGSGVEVSVTSPQNYRETIGRVIEASKEDVEWALSRAVEGAAQWERVPVAERAAVINRYADLLEAHMPDFLALASLEAGKTLADGVAEVREAVDFCRYYAARACEMMEKPLALEGYTGERNELSLHPRGTVLCISPWNFPLAIFTGQAVAALVTGNAVIAKPAEQTPLIAAFAVRLMREAGVLPSVMQLLPGKGETVGAALVADPRIKAVMFTGSTDTANRINQTLAARSGEIVPLIAETGGLNAMLVDSSALLEQVVNDVLVSAFGSAGQRCSALRVVHVQDEVYPRFIALLKGAMAELRVGMPERFDTDVGPVIDKDALAGLQAHVAKMREAHTLVYQCELPSACNNGYFFAPAAFEIPSIRVLEKEVFGPILHVVRFNRKDLDAVIDAINATGYGLTLGIHSRINETVERIHKRMKVGNCYVNRNMIGAVVGLQPFGGEGLSGTGPKAGGPHYLHRLCIERTFTVDTTAAGGNASLMALPEGV